MSAINNLPDYAAEFPYIVCSVVDDQLWFWGAYNNSDKAYQVAAEMDCVVVENHSI